MDTSDSLPSDTLRLEAYTDAEVQAAVQELFTDKSFLAGMAGFLPVELYTHILQTYEQVDSAASFQSLLMVPFLEHVCQLSVREWTVSGLEQLDPAGSYLFISNHRDIGLDSAFLNWALLKQGFRTSQIAIGDNLMKHRLAELIFRINKSFVVLRSGSARELYAHSIRMSQYIHALITKAQDSVWIAQREGRAKDGNDRTQVALLKMLSLGAGEDLLTWFQSLRVVPVAISYEWHPTDLLQTQEYLARLRDPGYRKTFAQDMSHLFVGIRGQKGRIHLHFDGRFQEQLSALGELPGPKAQLQGLAAAIDRSIHQNYRLRAINYVAADLLAEEQQHAAHYSPQEYDYYAAWFA
ncbi:MAG: glycerol acyltransferase, partial [Bacteroidetes bacterium]